MAEAHSHKTFQFELVSSERVLLSEQAVMAIVPGAAGEFGVLVNHAPLLSSIRPGVVAVHLPNGEVKKIFVAGGFADVNGKLCSVLAEEAAYVDQIDRAEVEDALKKLAAELSAAGEDAIKAARVQQHIAVARAKLAAAA